MISEQAFPEIRRLQVEKRSARQQQCKEMTPVVLAFSRLGRAINRVGPLRTENRWQIWWHPTDRWLTVSEVVEQEAREVLFAELRKDGSVKEVQYHDPGVPLQTIYDHIANQLRERVEELRGSVDAEKALHEVHRDTGAFVRIVEEER